MGWSVIAVAKGFTSSVTDTVNASSSLNVAAGDMLFCGFSWQNAESGNTVTIDQSDGTDTFTPGNLAVNSNDIGGGSAWLLNASADGTFTPRMTVSASSRRLDFIVIQVRPDASETQSLDFDETPQTGSSNSLASSNANTSGTDEIVFGIGSSAGGSGFSNSEIDSTAATLEEGGAYIAVWYRILTATFTAGNATITAGNDLWICNIIGFKSVAAVGGVDVLATTDALVLTEYTATVNAETNVQAGVDALTLTTYQATISITTDVNVSASVANLTLTEQAATVNAETNVQAATDALTLATYSATINAETDVQTVVDALTLTTYGATVTLGVVINVGVDNLTLTEQNPTVNAARNVQTSVDVLTLTEQQATVNATRNISAGVASLTLSEFVADINLNVTVGVGVDALTLTEYAASVTATAATVIDWVGQKAVSSTFVPTGAADGTWVAKQAADGSWVKQQDS